MQITEGEEDDEKSGHRSWPRYPEEYQLHRRLVIRTIIIITSIDLCVN